MFFSFFGQSYINLAHVVHVSFTIDASRKLKGAKGVLEEYVEITFFFTSDIDPITIDATVSELDQLSNLCP